MGYVAQQGLPVSVIPRYRRFNGIGYIEGALYQFLCIIEADLFGRAPRHVGASLLEFFLADVHVHKAVFHALLPEIQ